MELAKINRYRDKTTFAEEARKRAFEYDLKYHGCSQAVVQALLDLLEVENAPLFMAATPFAAGLSMTGNNCGALIGGLMILGTVFGRRSMDEGMKGIITGIRPSRGLVKHFLGRQGAINCREITQTDLADPVKAEAYFASGGLEKCAGIAGEVAAFVAELLYNEKIRREQSAARGPAGKV